MPIQGMKQSMITIIPLLDDAEIRNRTYEIVY